MSAVQAGADVSVLETIQKEWIGTKVVAFDGKNFHLGTLKRVDLVFDGCFIVLLEEARTPWIRCLIHDGAKQPRIAVSHVLSIRQATEREIYEEDEVTREGFL